MAAFANNRSARNRNSNPHVDHHPPSNPTTVTTVPLDNDIGRAEDRTEQLPKGPCNYRDLNAGPKPPSCGCRRFWWRGTPQDVGALGLQQGSEWCICGHHACYHDGKEVSKKHARSTEPSSASKESTSQEKDQELHAQAISRRDYHNPTRDWLNTFARDGNGSLHAMRPPNTNTRMSGIHQIPSFHLTSSELRGNFTHNGSYGLGLEISKSMHAARMVSQSPTVVDPIENASLQIPSTRQASSEDNTGPDDAFRRHIMEQRRLMTPGTARDGAISAPAGLGLNVQASPHVVTASISGTPRVSGVADLINEAAEVVGTVRDATEAALQLQDPSTPRAGDAQVSQTIASSETLLNAVREIPGALERLTPILTSLQSHLSKHPDVSFHESINALVQRVTDLENTSFNQISPDRFHEQVEHIDLRLVELETQTQEHGRLLAGRYPDHESGRAQPRRLHVQEEQASFATSHSLDSATSSALIVAAIDREEAKTRLKAVENRLDDLEKIQLPSLQAPWQVEVVLLPWGRDLRGIWYTAEELAKPGTTQEDEDWIHGRRQSIAASLASSGWSSSAIQQWTENDDEKLLPRACGTNGIVYHRLKSRGLVRTVTLKSSGAKDFLGVVQKRFGEVLQTISADNADGDRMDDDSPILGLNGPFVPLRKVHKSSRLRFLDSAELVTPALWTAHFLASGVLMRASGDVKRLFLTTPAGYEQDEDTPGWTWTKLRELPRVHDSQNNEQVLEGDAREPCWKHNPVIDVAPSVESSFQSRVQDSFDQAQANTGAERSALQPAEELSDDELAFHHPITPVSEFPPTQRTPSLHRRTLSGALSDFAVAGKSKTDSLPQPLRPMSQQSKRRIRSFEQAQNPALIAALPTFVPSSPRNANRSMRIKKRRRVTRSRSASSAEPVSHSQSSAGADVQSLHPEADPEQVLKHLQSVIPQGGEIMPLAHFAPPRQRSISFGPDVASQSTGHIVAARSNAKRGVTPSAYATPFSGTVVGTSHADDEYNPSDSGEDDWGGVDGENGSSGEDNDADMLDNDSQADLAEGQGSSFDEEDEDEEEDGIDDELYADEEELLGQGEDELLGHDDDDDDNDEDDEMGESSEDELQSAYR